MVRFHWRGTATRGVGVPFLMRVALAWGCGVGSLLALDALVREGHDVVLVHVPSPAGTWRHVPPFVVEDQAAALGLPLVLAEGDAPELARLSTALARARADLVAFGYLRGEEYEKFHLAKAVGRAETPALLPVRHVPPAEAARQLVEGGARAFVRGVAEPFAPALLGRFLDAASVDEVEGTAGPKGWASLRTLVVGGPRFRRTFEVTALDAEAVAGGWRLGLGLRGC